MFIHTTGALVGIQEDRFNVASRHSRRVAFYALMLAKEPGMSVSELRATEDLFNQKPGKPFERSGRKAMGLRLFKLWLPGCLNNV
jgi:hypothetical protein